METMLLTPVSQVRKINPFKEIEDAVILTTSQDTNNKAPRKQFIESNTKEVCIQHLKHECVIPVFSKDNEVTISHTNFIETVQEAACMAFPREKIASPDIRVSHLIKGRTPDAVHKPVSELQEEDKTLYYERMAFTIEIPTIYEDIKGNQLTLTVGGVRAYNHENLYSKKTFEKFKVFIGFKNLVCCNLCISTDGFKEEIKAMSTTELQQKVVELFQMYNIVKHIHLLNSFKNYQMTEHQFAQMVGKTRLYQCLSPKEQKLLPKFEFNDGQLNIIARSYYRDEDFKKNPDGSINLWNLYNLFTGANKNSYIDSILDRAVNATDFLQGISLALSGDSRYRWFID